VGGAGGCGIEGQGAGGQESGRGEGRAGGAGGAGDIGGGEGGGQRMVVLGVQLRFGGHYGYSQLWNDPVYIYIYIYIYMI